MHVLKETVLAPTLALYDPLAHPDCVDKFAFVCMAGVLPNTRPADARRASDVENQSIGKIIVVVQGLRITRTLAIMNATIRVRPSPEHNGPMVHELIEDVRITLRPLRPLPLTQLLLAHVRDQFVKFTHHVHGEAALNGIIKARPTFV